MVGNNGAGKTTLLKLIAGEVDLDRDDKRQGPGIISSRKLTVGYLKQQAFDDKDRTVEEELLSSCPAWDPFARERFEYEREYDTLFTGFGFTKEDKKKKDFPVLRRRTDKDCPYPLSAVKTGYPASG